MPRVNDKRSILPLSGKRGEWSTDAPSSGAFATQQVPAGIEQLLGMAASDAAFATALLGQPQMTIEASGIALSPAEREVLAATPQATLRQMIASVGRHLPNDERRSFLSLTATALLALAGGGLAATGCAKKGPTQRSDAAVPPAKGAAEPPAVTMRAPPTHRKSLNRLTDIPPRRIARPTVSLTGILPRQGPAVKMGTGKVTGGLDLPTVRRALRRHLMDLKYCYVYQYLEKGHKAADGKLIVQFAITAAGKVKKAKVTDNSTGDKVLTQCVSKAMAGWRFPKSAAAKPTQVSWRFNLTAGDG